MPRVFLLTSDPDAPVGGLSPVSLAAALPGDRFSALIGHLGRPEPNRGFKGTVVPFDVRFPFDPVGWGFRRFALRGSAPELIHAIGPDAIRVARLMRFPGLAPRARPKLIASGCGRTADGLAGRLTDWALRAADRVVAETRAEAGRLVRAGIVAERVIVIPPAVSPAPPPDPTAFRRSLGIPDAARLILAAGAFDRDAALKDAAWAFDILKYAAPDLHLVLVGDGPERERVERFARGIGADDYRTRFAGPRADLPSLFALAEVVWVTHRRGGVSTALESMAAGKPVVAVGTPDLAETVADGVSGVLVPPGDRVRMAAVTAELLAGPERAAVLGAAGRAAAGRFSVAAMAERYASVYHSVVNKS